MTLTVETGSGLSNADSYNTLAEITTHLADYGDDDAAYLALSTTEQEVRARNAFRFMGAAFATRWIGRRLLDSQSAAWPRSGAVDNDEFAVGYNSVPARVKQAHAILTAKASSAELLPDTAAGSGPLKSKEVHAGPVGKSVTYAGVAVPYPTYNLVLGILSPLLVSGLLLERG